MKLLYSYIKGTICLSNAIKIRDGKHQNRIPNKNSISASAAVRLITYSLLLIVYSLFTFSLSAQEPRKDSGVDGLPTIHSLQIGDAVPVSLWNLPLKMIGSDNKIVQTNLMRFQDKKLIILDFWATWCGTCLEAFPKLVDLSRKFSGEIQILPVTRQDHEKVISYLQDRGGEYRDQFPFIVEASEVKSYFPHHYLPHVVILSGGKVLDITTSKGIDMQRIQELLHQSTQSL